MLRRYILSLTLLLAVLALGAQTTYLHCGKLVDVAKGEVLRERTIVVEGNTITRVARGYLMPPPSATLIDLKGMTVMPGLIDCHVHLEMEYNKSTYLNRFILNEADIAFNSVVFAGRTIDAGFTTVRDLGGTGVNVALAKATADGRIRGPRIYTAAKAIAITGGHADPTNGAKHNLFDPPTPTVGVADGPDAARKAVRQQVKNGADLIKITATGGVLSVARDGHRPQFTLEEIQAIVETANDFGIHVAAHAHGAEGMKRAVLGGVKSIEHGTMMTEEVMRLMKERGTYYVPTITAGKAVGDSARVPGYYPAVVTPKALEIGPKIQATFARAYRYGVPIAFGTDAGVFPHGKNGLEFVYMHEAGMPMMEILQTATIHAADLLDASEQIGTIEAGKLADIIAVDGDFLNDPTVMLNVDFVMKDGKVYKQ